jgi:hypothetical protein
MNQIELKPSVVGVVMTDKADQILKALRTSRNNIKVLSDQIAENEVAATAVKGELEHFQAKCFVEAATTLNQVGKLVYPNLDSQKAAVEMAIHESTDYQQLSATRFELLKEIQIKKNTIVCEHERRGDLKTEVELLKLLAAEAI